MNRADLLNMLTNYAKRYRNHANESIQRNKHMNDIELDEVIQQRIIDTVLTDFINEIAMNQGVDYALYASDLTTPKPIT